MTRGPAGFVKGRAPKGGGPRKGNWGPETTGLLTGGLGPPSPTGSRRDGGDEEAATGAGSRGVTTRRR